MRIVCALLSLTFALAPVAAQEVESDVAQRVDDLFSTPVSVQPVNDFIHRIEGAGAFFLINTSEGAVLVDTGNATAQNDEQRKALREHARTDPGEVERYVRAHEGRLSALSRREALRNLP